MVPAVDLTRRAARYRDRFVEAIDRVMCSGVVLLGAETEAFEAEMAAAMGAAHGVAVASGASALSLSLAALGVGPGDEVIVPAFTAVPTAAAVCAVGAVPVPVDVDPTTAAIDPTAVIAARTERTAAIMPVHLYGRPFSLVESGLLELGVPVVEDAAQAHGALVPPSQSGSAAACYSFYPTKNLGGMGDGGMVVTDDADLAARLRRLRVHGMAAMYEHVEVAMNSRLSELEAAWLRLVLPDLEAGNARRAEIAARYRAAAPSLRGQAPHERHVHHLSVVRVADRQRFRDAMAEREVATAVHYPLALNGQPAYRHFARHACPEAAAWARECVSLPCFPELTDEEVDIVCSALHDVEAKEFAC
ncbi:MAG: DegT/DnrJ/EryC1/StrS family aminotransferase [Actinobacteria bacterium]|nr:DegT/DnrJ/EryC1/StrS family aminotransferase [Actinomycetota bacterium]